MSLPPFDERSPKGLRVRARSVYAFMAKELIPYLEMCRREGAGLRRGMHFGLGGTHSVLLMSNLPRAPYRDRVVADGATLIYEGHDELRSAAVPHPKVVDQPLRTAYGTPTQNAKFHQAADAYKHGQRPPEQVRVYEKCRPGLWRYRGLFHLVDSWQESDGKREVFKFKLVAADGQDEETPQELPPRLRRYIPRAVKSAVWQRDGGQCVVCGSVDKLHFDHVIPISQGGPSNRADNIQLLCARHNLAKGAQAFQGFTARR
jgi:HNH endonuclease